MSDQMYFVALSQYAKSQVEERTEYNLCNSEYRGRDYSILVDLCADWAYRYLPRDLKYLGEGGYNDGIQVEDDLYKIWLDSSRVWAFYRFMESPIGSVNICVESFNYKKGDTKRPTLNGEVVLEQDRTYDISDLSEFHSWMKRLDEVKGARPTYWCK